MVLADGRGRGGDKRLGERLTDPVASVVTQVGQGADGDIPERRGRRVFAEDGGGQHALEIRDVAREFREAEIDQAVDLADPIADVLDQAIPEMDEFLQFLGRAVGQPRRRGALLETQVAQAVAPAATA